MARVRKIARNPKTKNYYIVDTCFLVNKYLPEGKFTDLEKTRIIECKKWWKEIDNQLKADKAKVFIPDICIAEAFKVLAKKCFFEKRISNNEYAKIKDLLGKDIRTTTKDLKANNRKIDYHDISTNRDIIISTDRFLEAFSKHNPSVQIADLILLATAKYLIDFFDFDIAEMQIVTLDSKLRNGANKLKDVPYAYDPSLKTNRAEVIFITNSKET
jgi:predicted nucleic acid-binding protein